jgi:hypothetical protein
MILRTRKIDAYKFFSMNNFFMYSLGPLRKAIAAIIEIIANVKHSTKLEGDITRVGSIMKQTKMSPIVIRKLAAAQEYDLSLDMQLNRERKRP